MAPCFSATYLIIRFFFLTTVFLDEWFVAKFDKSFGLILKENKNFRIRSANCSCPNIIVWM